MSLPYGTMTDVGPHLFFLSLSSPIFESITSVTLWPTYSSPLPPLLVSLSLKDEMRRLPISDLSAPNSLLFLWVTARAMELGRELLTYWGFKRVDEIVWAKTNQVGKLIRTGRTGHWLK